MKCKATSNRTWRKQGSVLVLFLFAVFVVLGLLHMTGNLAALSLNIGRGQMLADAVALSVVSVRADALNQLTQKAQPLEEFVETADEAGLYVKSARWGALAKAALQLKNSVPGYKGHITSTLRVVMDANQANFQNLFVIRNSAHQLDVQPNSAVVSDENGHSQLFSSIWLQRIWDDDEFSLLQIQQPTWAGILKKEASVKMVWNGLGDDHAYPRQWADVCEYGQFRPYKNPHYRAVLAQTP